jgi:hypothetical protein
MDTITSALESSQSEASRTGPGSEAKTEEITTGPQTVKREDSGRSIFDVDFSKLGALEPITKAITITAIISYAAGFLIVVINEGRLGFLDSSLLKPRAMIVGIVALLLIVLPISLTRGVHIRPRNDKESRDQKVARVGLSLIDFFASCGAAWFVASFVFVGTGSDLFFTVHDGTVVPHGLQFAGWMLFVVLIAINGAMLSPSDRRAYWKAPRFWISYSILWLALMTFAGWMLWRTDSAVYFAWSLLTSIFFHAYARDWRLGFIRSFKLPAVLLWSLSLLSLYATFLFPKIKGNWGGGTPIPALLTLANATGSTPSEGQRINLIEATDSGYYITLEGKKNVVYIPRSSVLRIEFTTQVEK